MQQCGSWEWVAFSQLSDRAVLLVHVHVGHVILRACVSRMGSRAKCVR